MEVTAPTPVPSLALHQPLDPLHQPRCVGGDSLTHIAGPVAWGIRFLPEPCSLPVPEAHDSDGDKSAAPDSATSPGLCFPKLQIESLLQGNLKDPTSFPLDFRESSQAGCPGRRASQPRQAPPPPATTPQVPHGPSPEWNICAQRLMDSYNDPPGWASVPSYKWGS